MRWLGILFVVACSREPVDAGGPQRVVSLTPSATEVVATLDATALLVGVDDYSDVPPEVTKLPKVGTFLTPNLETIVRAAADARHRRRRPWPGRGCARRRRRRERSNVRSTLSKTSRPRSIASATGSDAAPRPSARSRASMHAIDDAAAHRPSRRPRVLAVIDREADGLGNLVAAGPGSWIDELLTMAGGDNVLAAAGVRYPKISLEEVLRGRPDVILDLSFAGKNGIAPWLTVDVPGGASQRVIALNDPFDRAIAARRRWRSSAIAPLP